MFGILLFEIPTDATNPQTIDLNFRKSTYVFIVWICLNILILSHRIVIGFSIMKFISS